MHYQGHDLEQSFFHLIKRTSKAFRRRLNHSFAEAGYDVTSEQWRILWCLWRQDGQRQQDLADSVYKDKTSITRTIDSMERRNLVVRVPDRIDRRQKLIHLTNKARELQEDLIQLVQKISLEAQRGIEPEHLEILRDSLAKIRENLCNP